MRETYDAIISLRGNCGAAAAKMRAFSGPGIVTGGLSKVWFVCASVVDAVFGLILRLQHQ